MVKRLGGNGPKVSAGETGQTSQTSEISKAKKTTESQRPDQMGRVRKGSKRSLADVAFEGALELGGKYYGTDSHGNAVSLQVTGAKQRGEEIELTLLASSAANKLGANRKTVAKLLEKLHAALGGTVGS